MEVIMLIPCLQGPIVGDKPKTPTYQPRLMGFEYAQVIIQDNALVVVDTMAYDVNQYTDGFASMYDGLNKAIHDAIVGRVLLVVPEASPYLMEYLLNLLQIKYGISAFPAGSLDRLLASTATPHALIGEQLQSVKCQLIRQELDFNGPSGAENTATVWAEAMNTMARLIPEFSFEDAFAQYAKEACHVS